MQALANRLAGQHMALLLQRSGLPVSAAALQSAEAFSIRMSGVAAALVQELSIYRKSNTKLVPHCPLTASHNKVVWKELMLTLQCCHTYSGIHEHCSKDLGLLFVPASFSRARGVRLQPWPAE